MSIFKEAMKWPTPPSPKDIKHFTGEISLFDGKGFGIATMPALFVELYPSLMFDEFDADTVAAYDKLFGRKKKARLPRKKKKALKMQKVLRRE